MVAAKAANRRKRPETAGVSGWRTTPIASRIVDVAIRKETCRVTVWAPGAKGVAVTCACGWKDRAVTTMGAYAKKRKHMEEGGPMNGTTRTSDVIDYTVGRATNDDLEQAVAVHFKHEYEGESGMAYGPVWLQVGGVAPDDVNPLGSGGRMVTFRVGDEPEWHSEEYGEALARELDVKFVAT
jgi:hypothetical protein